MSLLAPLLPSGVCVAESRDLLASSAEYPQEAAAVVRAAPQRRDEFGTGRELARRALADLGLPAAPIPRGERGAPLWPDAVVGSIAHTEGYAVAAVAHAAALASLGIDVQPVVLLPPEAVMVVTSPAELERLTRAAGDLAALLAFVAKEAVFKAWWPLTGRELDFDDVALWADESGLLIAELADPDPALAQSGGRAGLPWEVRWRVSDGLLLAAVAVLR